MRIVDARSGKEMKLGDRVDYGDGEWLKLVDADVGLFSGEAFLERCYRHYPSNKLVTDRIQTPLTVRWMHPSFMFRQVAFIPS